MDLAELTGRSELTVEVAGCKYHFSELPLGRLADLQAWIRQHVPNPLDSIREHLSGLPESVQMHLAENARRDALKWPPEVGTAEGAQVLLGSQLGQIETLYHGLLVHQPNATRDDASKLYSVLKRNRDEALVRRIYATIFGTNVIEKEEVAVKKTVGAKLGRNGN